MMINYGSNILQALSSNVNIVSIVGYDKDGQLRIYNTLSPYSQDFPRISFFEFNNTDSDYADDAAWASEINFQIDLWNKGSNATLALEVDTTMKSLNFKRTSSIDLYEPDTRVFHKAMRYSGTILI